MTKAYLKFPRRATRYSSSRFAHSTSSGVAYLTDAEKLEQDQLIERIKTQTNQLLENRATKQEVEDIMKAMPDFKDFPLEALREMADKDKGVNKQLVELGLRMQKIEQGKQSEKPMTVRQQVEKWQKDNESKINAIRGGERNVSLPALEIRAVASPMTVATVNSGSSPYIGRTEQESGINGILRYPNVFWESLTKGRTNAETYTWVNMTNPQGAAAWIGPGVAKPGISFEFVADKSNAKKIADSAKAATELLQDIDGMTTFIEQELKEQVFLKVNSTLMDSVGSSTVPTGIKQLSVAYTETGIKTTNPNKMDALRAVVAQLRSGKLAGEITIYINSIDAANMDLEKATDSGVYLLPPFITADGKSISGARILEDQNVPTGEFQAGFMRFYRILMYKDFSVSWGWENDDFTKNLVTAIGELRMHQFFNERHTGAFVNDTFANVIAAITA